MAELKSEGAPLTPEQQAAYDDLYPDAMGMASQRDEDLLFFKLKDLITEQSEGEWDDATIVRDAHHFANHLRPFLATTQPAALEDKS